VVCGGALLLVQVFFTLTLPESLGLGGGSSGLVPPSAAHAVTPTPRPFPAPER
jgi:hypothetical protein